MKDLEAELDLPMDEDENIGDGAPKKRVKRKKTREERAAERKVVFWTLVIIFGVTIFFWLWPKMKELNIGWPTINVGGSKVESPKTQWKNYVEYKL